MQANILMHLEQDPVLQEIIASTTLPELPIGGDLYSSLIRSIVFQQLSGKAASTIYGRFLDLFEERYPKQAMIKAYDISHTGKALKIRMIEIARPWQPYRSYASRLLWQWLDN